MSAVERISEKLGGKLRPYFCTADNPRTGRPCRTVLLEAWSPGGAVVRRRCKQCGQWATVVVRADSSGSEDVARVLD